MEQNKKNILLEQVQKLESVISTLKANFDCESEIADEYSFLNIVKENLTNLSKKD